MKKYFPLLLLLLSCGSPENESGSDVNQHGLENNDDTMKYIEQQVPEEIEPEVKVNINLIELLDNPLDLEAYKKKWGSSNSGGLMPNDILYQPDTVGQFYNYMMFWKLRTVILSHPSEGDLLNDFVITVYKYGEEIGDFYDTNEELIMIKCSLDNTTLGDLNWFGKSEIDILDQYGPPQFEQDDCLIYYYDHKTITAHLENDRVDWYKYVRLNDEIDLSAGIPSLLLRF